MCIERSIYLSKIRTAQPGVVPAFLDLSNRWGTCQSPPDLWESFLQCQLSKRRQVMPVWTSYPARTWMVLGELTLGRTEKILKKENKINKIPACDTFDWFCCATSRPLCVVRLWKWLDSLKILDAWLDSLFWRDRTPSPQQHPKLV